jgi:hypothetical protein
LRCGIPLPSAVVKKKYSVVENLQKVLAEVKNSAINFMKFILDIFLR